MFILLRDGAQVSVAKNGSTIAVATLRSGDCYVMEIGKDVMGEVIRESSDCLTRLSELLAKRKMETEGIIKDATTSDADQAAKQREDTATFLNRLKTFFAL